MTVFGTSAKYLAALEALEARPGRDHDLSRLRLVLSTGSPLLDSSYDYVYDAIGDDLSLASICGELIFPISAFLSAPLGFRPSRSVGPGQRSVYMHASRWPVCWPVYFVFFCGGLGCGGGTSVIYNKLLHRNFAQGYTCVLPAAGGTDLNGCFVGGVPWAPVIRGEIQGAGLGLAVQVYDAGGSRVRNTMGELVCEQAFPSMPLSFYGDEDGSSYQAAYFDKYPGVWHHGDYMMLTDDGQVRITGRSDATLNPGGVRHH